MVPGGWGAEETGGFFHTLEVCEGVWSSGAVCVLVLQAVGCLCSNRGWFPCSQLCSSAAPGSTSLAATWSVPWLSLHQVLSGSEQVHKAAGHQESGGRMCPKQGIESGEVSLGLGWQLTPESWGQRGSPRAAASSRSASSAPGAQATRCWPPGPCLGGGWVSPAGG